MVTAASVTLNIYSISVSKRGPGRGLMQGREVPHRGGSPGHLRDRVTWKPDLSSEEASFSWRLSDAYAKRVP